MPFYKDKQGNINFIIPRYWKHVLKMHPEIKEVIPQPIIEDTSKVTKDETPELGYTQFNALEKPLRNVSTAKRSQRKTRTKVR